MIRLEYAMIQKQRAVKYCYTLQVGKEACFWKIQKKANALYSKHINFVSHYFQTKADNSMVFEEIQIFDSEDDYLLTKEIQKLEPGLVELFNEFLTILDPGKEITEHECYHFSL